MTHFLMLAVALAACATAQEAPVPGFEVVSIKPSANPPVRTGMYPIPGTLTIGNYSLKRLVAECYRLKSYQLSGGPPWIDSEHFDIVAKCATKASMGEMVRMLIPMMADRFQLQIHHETKELPAYALTLAKGGAKMQPATETARSFGIYSTAAITEIKAFRLGMRQFADILSGELNLPVADETNLTGEFQFNLRYVTDDLRPKETTDSPSDPGATIFAAVQEQLGLKLEPRKRPVDTIVIDHAERPASN